MIIPLREFQLHASTYLPIKEEIELTRYGKTVAILSPPVKIVYEDNFKVSPKFIETPADVPKIVQTTLQICEHGSAKGLCKHGCK